MVGGISPRRLRSWQREGCSTPHERRDCVLQTNVHGVSTKKVKD